MNNTSHFFTKTLLITAILISTLSAYSQEPEGTKPVYHFNGNMSVTNNGFSFIPLFSLGKPAAVANLSVGGGRFSFDPQFRFDLEGFKPWTFIFIWRYTLIQKEQFQMKVGMHLPTYSFREVSSVIDGETQVRLVPYRLIAVELMPTYTISEHISIGAYYVSGFAVEEFDETRHIDYLSLRAHFAELHLSKQVYLNWGPEVYYLNLYGVDGFFAAQSISLAHEKIPVSVSTTMNIKLKSEFEAKSFDWNISLVYTFSNELTKR
jgi:hypothetical protein